MLFARSLIPRKHDSTSLQKLRIHRKFLELPHLRSVDRRHYTFPVDAQIRLASTGRAHDILRTWIKPVVSHLMRKPRDLPGNARAAPPLIPPPEGASRRNFGKRVRRLGKVARIIVKASRPRMFPLRDRDQPR